LITVYAAMYVILGFLLAAFLLLLVLPAYRRRIERFAVEKIKRTLPLSEEEIKADKDRIRAQFAIHVHNLEMKLEEGSLAAARQSVELNRRDAKINDLEQTIAAHKMSVEEHENARRVLEQAILDRLPKVEQRLSEARKLLVQRDREIMLLTDTGAKQSEALEEATQINVQQRQELARLKGALETRAARNRETIGDPRFDGEVALRSELEELRAKSREQAALIDNLQKKERAQEPQTAESEESIPKLAQLKSELAEAEARILAFESNGDDVRVKLDARIKELEGEAETQAQEMEKMKAALKAFADNAADPKTGRPSAGLTAKVEISQLQAEVEQSRATIDSLRAEIANSNERLVRQAEHFRDELRRLGAGDREMDKRVAQKRPLAERIAAPRVPSKTANDVEALEPGDEARGSAVAVFKKVNGGSASEAATSSGDDAVALKEPAKAARRRPRLLDRISGLDK
jgi:hypothetical protein